MPTTNLPIGVTNSPLGSVLQSYVDADPTVVHQYWNDFDVYTAGDWTNTATGAATNAVTAGDGGILSMANSAANNDLDSLQLKAASFQITQGKDAWFKTRFQISNATNAALVLGLIQTTVTPLTVTDGFYLAKAAASTTLTAKVAKASAISTVNVGTLADATMVVVGLHYNSDANAVIVYLNGNRVGQLATTNLPFATNLNLTIAVANGTAAANTLLVDYAFMATIRPSTQNN
jgi:hypothetical protein